MSRIQIKTGRRMWNAMDTHTCEVTIGGLQFMTAANSEAHARELARKTAVALGFEYGIAPDLDEHGTAGIFDPATAPEVRDDVFRFAVCDKVALEGERCALPELHAGGHSPTPRTTDRQFQRQSESPLVAGYERCKNCDKHLRHHFGLTEYRCDPRPDA